MASLIVTPNPTNTSDVANVLASGLTPKAKYRLWHEDPKYGRLGVTNNVGRVPRNGQISDGIMLSAYVGEQVVGCELSTDNGKTWKLAGTGKVTVQKAVVTPPPVEPPPIVTPPPGTTRGPQPVAYRTPAATVAGTSLADMNAAMTKAGTNGVIFVPAGVYPAPSLTIPGQVWQLDPNAVISTRIDPKARGVAFEGGELRGGAWLGMGTTAHDTRFQSMRIRGQTLNNESRSNLQLVNCDFRDITGEWLRMWYDSTSHADVQGFRFENCTGVRTAYSENGVCSVFGHDGGGVRKLYDGIIRNNLIDGGADVGQDNGKGSFAIFEIWGMVRQINEYNDLDGAGFLNSNVRSQDGRIRFNKWHLGRAYTAYESGGSGTGGDIISDNEITANPARNAVIVYMSQPNPVRPVEVTRNRYSGCKLATDTATPGYNFHDNLPVAA